SDRSEIKQVEKITKPGECDKKRRREPFAQNVANQRAKAPQHGAADTDACFHPRIARRVFQGDERTHKRNKDRRANFESELFSDKQMSGFMHQQEQDKSERESPAPHLGIDPDQQQHGSAGFQQDRKELQERQQNKLQLCEKLRDHDADYSNWTKGFLHPAPRSFLGRRLVLFDWFGLKIHSS